MVLSLKLANGKGTKPMMGIAKIQSILNSISSWGDCLVGGRQADPLYNSLETLVPSLVLLKLILFFLACFSICPLKKTCFRG